MRAVTAYPTTGPRSGNSARTSPDRLPASRGLTLKVSMAFATVGLDRVRRAAIWLDESGTGLPPGRSIPERYIIAFDDPTRVAASGRSEERRVGKECRSRWSPYQ